jgi:hypothetical protein
VLADGDPDGVLDGYRSYGYRIELLDGTDLSAADSSTIAEHYPAGKKHLTLVLAAD